MFLAIIIIIIIIIIIAVCKFRSSIKLWSDGPTNVALKYLYDKIKCVKR